MSILHKKAFGGLLFLLLVMAAVLFIPAWTLDYLQALSFLAVYFNWPLRARAAPDVCGRDFHASRHTDRARFVVGRAHRCCDDASTDMETVQRGKIPGTESAGLRRVPK